jgi:hypothetical protein
MFLGQLILNYLTLKKLLIMIKNFKWLFLVSLTVIACNDDEDLVVVNNSSDGLPLTAGSADFSKYVALGDSFAAGFSDNALFIEGQKTSYPSIMAQQFTTVGGGAFKVPFMADNIGGFAGSTTYLQRLYFTGVATSPIGMVTGPSTTVQGTVLTGGFNNFGIPGAKVGDLDLPGYGSALGNPYFARFATAPLATAVDDAIAQTPTFFSLFIGGNDVLGYAASGGTGTVPTAPTTFDTKYNGLITKLTAGGRKGVVGNLPYITSLPLFTTVPTNPVPGLPAANVASLNQLFGGINAALTANGLPARFATLVADDGNPATTESNPLLINDESLIPIEAQITLALTSTYGPALANNIGKILSQARHATNTTGSTDYILLTTRTVINATVNGADPNTTVLEAPNPLIASSFSSLGISHPLQDRHVVTIAEANEIKTATDAYNVTIEAAATAKGLAFVDTKSVMNKLSSTTGITANGYTITSAFIFGGAFSLDGVHPSPRGYALIANEFIKAINLKYGSNIGAVSFADYRIHFPKVL